MLCICVVCMYSHVCGGQRSILSVILYHMCVYVCKCCIPLDLELIDWLGWLASKTQRFPLFLPSQHLKNEVIGITQVLVLT